MPTLTTSPWSAAVERFSDKTLVGSRLRSGEWEDVPLALREQALFSAGVENTRTLAAMREKILAGLEQASPGGTGMDRSRFVAELRRLLGAEAGDSGDLADLTSRRRLELIWDFQVAEAHAHAAHQADLDPDLLDGWPAYRLVRIEERLKVRDWARRWAAAGAQVGWQGASQRALVALKTSPIWAALSRFGQPWPPFDFGSGMGLEDVERDEAEQLGLLPKGQPPAERLRQLREASATARRGWGEQLEASVKGLGEEAKSWLKETFGDQIELSGDTVRWARRSTPVQPTPDQPTARAAWQGLSASTPGQVPAPLARPAAVEVAAVGDGTKRVYHEEVGPELAPRMADWLRQGAGPAVDVWSREGHVFARRNYGPAREEIERRILGGGGGDLLGYGAETMFAPGRWIVNILNESGEQVAGFHADPATAEAFARQRLRDWQRATGQKHTIRIIKP